MKKKSRILIKTLNNEINHYENNFLLLKTFIKKEEEKDQLKKDKQFYEHNSLKGGLYKERDPRFWFDKTGVKTKIIAVDRCDYLNLNRISSISPITELKFKNNLIRKKISFYRKKQNRKEILIKLMTSFKKI